MSKKMPQLISAANSLADTRYQTDSHSSQSFTQMHGKTHPVPMLKIAFVSVHHRAAALSQLHHTVFRSQGAYFGKTTPVSNRKLQTLTAQCGNSTSFSITASGSSLHSPHYHHTTSTPSSSTSSSLKAPGRRQHSV